LGELERTIFRLDEAVADEFAGFRVGGDVRSVSGETARFAMAVCFLASARHNFPNRLKTHAFAVITHENPVKTHARQSRFDSSAGDLDHPIENPHANVEHGQPLHPCLRLFSVSRVQRS
jgi:hypothetical protein